MSSLPLRIIAILNNQWDAFNQGWCTGLWNLGSIWLRYLRVMNIYIFELQLMGSARHPLILQMVSFPDGKKPDKPFPLITTALQAELGWLPYWSTPLSALTPALDKTEFPLKHFKTLQIILVKSREVQFFPLDFFIFHNPRSFALAVQKEDC